MTNTTDTYWEVDGVSLNTRAWNIETLEGRLNMPTLRGEDEVIPHRPGERWLPKIAGSRTLSLAMWAIGSRADGSIDAERKDIFDDNIRALQTLFWTPGRQFQLKKRFKVGGVIKTATASAEYAGGLEPSMIGRYGAKVVVKVKLADPYFYDDNLVTTNLVNGNQNVTVLGDADTPNILFTINGARNIPKVRNNTLATEFTYNGNLATGTRLEVTNDLFVADYYPASGPSQRMRASMLHAGSPLWMYLRPGVNQINVSSSTGTGTVVMKHRAAYL